MFIETAKACIEELDGRKGFDHFWGDLDEDIQEEIVQALAEVIQQHVTKT